MFFADHLFWQSALQKQMRITIKSYWNQTQKTMLLGIEQSIERSEIGLYHELSSKTEPHGSLKSNHGLIEIK